MTLEEALVIARGAVGGEVQVRDYGLLESALARPRTQLFGEETYTTLGLKAAPLLQSLVGNYPLLDGNKRLGFACTAVFLHINGHPLKLNEDEAYDLTMDVAAGRAGDLAEISERLLRS
nr:type II toxin-antitoxin system death-on-curing family toxin [Arthrobacter sp. SF27]